MKTYSVAMPEDLFADLSRHLIRDDYQEDLCFALWDYSCGALRYSALISEIIFPLSGEHQVHGNVSFNSKYLDRVLGLALRKNMGIAFLHSHPTKGWQDMSKDDIKTEKYLAPIIKATTNLPLVGLTMGIDGALSARFWNKTSKGIFERNWCETVRIVGNTLSITFNDKILPKPKPTEKLLRTVSAWGKDTQAKISRLKIGIIGAGSVGSIIAECLSKIGITDVKIIDFDTLEEKNLDRTLHAQMKDVGKAKSEVLAAAIKKSAVAKKFKVESIDFSIAEEYAFRKALDRDLLFSCVDRPWPRYILDLIAYAHLIPVIDGGIRVKTNTINSQLIAADWKTNIASPNRPCLECIGQYSPEDVALEQTGLLDDSNYINGIDKSHFIHRNENVFAFSLGVGFLEIQQFLSLVIAPFGIGNIGGKVYHFITGDLQNEKVKDCLPTCSKKNYLATGDKKTSGLISRHFKAEEVREKRQQLKYLKLK